LVATRAVIRNLWSAVDAGGSVDLSKTSFYSRLSDFGFAAGRSTHADRLATIRDTFEKYGLMIDTHTADGLKVARELRTPEMPMVVLETALPAKFEETIIEALGRRPERPVGLRGHRRPAATGRGDRRQCRRGEGDHPATPGLITAVAEIEKGASGALFFSMCCGVPLAWALRSVRGR
jgi:threonine synthase